MLPYITRDEAQRPSLFGPSLEEALGPGLGLTSEDLDAEGLLNRLRRLIPAQGRALGPLDADQVDEIRSVLHPEVRIGWGGTSDEIVRVMDREQERLARTLGDGHRLLCSLSQLSDAVHPSVLQAGSGQVDRGECGLGSNQRRPRYSEGVAPVHRRNARLKALTSE